MEVNEARRLKELERENTELKKMLADAMLENRVLKFAGEKKGEPGPSPAKGASRSRRRWVLRAQSVSNLGFGALDVALSQGRAQGPACRIGRAYPCADAGAPAATGAGVLGKITWK